MVYSALSRTTQSRFSSLITLGGLVCDTDLLSQKGGTCSCRLSTEGMD